MKFIYLSEEEFKSVQDRMPGSSFYQTVEWAGVKAETGWSYFYVGVLRGEKLAACALILSKELFMGRKMYYAPRGPLLECWDEELLSVFTGELGKFLKGRGRGILLKIDPLVAYRECMGPEKSAGKGICLQLINLGYRHQGFTVGYSPEAQFRWSYCLDIRKSREEVLAGMDQRCRRCIRKAEKYPLTTVDVDASNIDDFKAIMAHTAARQNRFDRSKQYYLSLKRHLGDRVKMVMVYLDRKQYLEGHVQDKLYEQVKRENSARVPLSAGVFILDADRMNYVYGGAYAHYMPLMAQYKLQMDMIMFSMEKKLSLYDFGGISGDFRKDSPNYGVYEFKRGFGGFVVEYIGEFDLVLRPGLYQLYSRGYRLYRGIKKTGAFARNRFFIKRRACPALRAGCPPKI